MKECILAHDLGTSGNKASLFDDSGCLVDTEVVSYRVYYSRTGWAEEDPEDWWYAVCKATKTVLERNPQVRVSAVAVSGQMMGALALDRQGRPLGKSIIWSDTRAESECAGIVSALGRDRCLSITGQPPSASYPLPKIVWQKNHLPELYREATVYLQAKDFINYRLTGAVRTDPTDAAYTIAYDIGKQDWSDEMLEAAGIPKKLFPEVVPCETVIGAVTAEASAVCGLAEGTPVVEGAGDGSAAHLGGACVENGDCYLCLGSSTWLAAQTENLVFDPEGRMQSEPHVIPGKYIYVGTMQTGGMAWSWARDNLNTPFRSYNDMEKAAATAPAGASGLLFMPYLMGERSPYYDLRCCAAFLGMRQGMQNGDLYRAVLEGVGMNLNILLKIIEQDVRVDKIVLIGGGGKSRLWQQILSDIFRKELLIPENTEAGTSIGAAIIAGVGTGIFEGYGCARHFLRISGSVSPNPGTEQLYARKQVIFEQAYLALRDINHQICDLQSL